MRGRGNQETVHELLRWLADGTARKIREDAGWSRERCARAMGECSVMSIIAWESGRSLPGRASAIAFHRLLTELKNLPPAPRRDRRFDNPGTRGRAGTEGQVEG